MGAQEEILKAILQGDESVMERIYDQNRPSFLAWAKKYYPLSEEQLIDVYQDTVIIFYQNVAEEKLTQLDSTLQTYLFGIGKNLIYKELRLLKKSPLQLDQVPELSVAPHFLEREEKDHARTTMRQALGQLGTTCRQLVEYFYYYGYNMEVIATRMRYKNADTVKAQKHRCMKQLEQILKQP